MTERDPSLDDLIAREKKAWEARALADATRPARTEDAIDRLHREIGLPLPGAARIAAPYLATVVVVALGGLAMSRLASPEPRGTGATPPAPSLTSSDAGPVARTPATNGPSNAQPDSPLSDHARVGTVPPVHPEAGEPRVAVRRDAGSNAAAPDGLARELSLLRDAQLSLRSGDADHALELAAAHAREFPAGTLAPERRALERRARCVLERRALDEPEDTCR